MAIRPTHETIARNGDLKITVNKPYQIYHLGFNSDPQVSISQEKKDDSTYDPKITGSTILEIEDRKKDETVRVAVKFGLSSDDITMGYHPEVRNDEGQVVFKEQLSLADVNASNIQIEPLGIKPTDYDTLPDFQARDVIEEYKSEIQDTLKDLTLSQTEGLGKLKNPSQYKGPSADVISYKMLAENPEKLVQRELMSLDRDFRMSSRHNSTYTHIPKVEDFHRYPYEGLSQEREIIANERLKLGGEQFNNDADFEARAKAYGLNKDSERVFPKNPVQQVLLDEVRQVAPPFSDDEKRLMVVTDNWNEPTFVKIAEEISESTYSVKESLMNADENQNGHPYEAVAKITDKVTNILLEATRIDDPKIVQAVENGIHNIYKQEIVNKLEVAEIHRQLGKSGYDAIDDPEDYDYLFEQYQSMDDGESRKKWEDKLDEYREDYLKTQNTNDNTISNTAKVNWRELPEALESLSLSQVDEVNYTQKDFDEKAREYGLSEDSVATHPKNDLQKTLLKAIENVAPLSPDAEQRLMVVTDNWNEPTLAKLSKLGGHNAVTELHSSLYDAIEQESERENTYSLLDEKAQEFTRILLEDAQITNPKQIEALKDGIYELYEESLIEHSLQFESLTKVIPSFNNNREGSSFSDITNITVTDFNAQIENAYNEIKEERSVFYKQILDKEKQEYFDNKLQNSTSNDLDELGVEVALLDIDAALEKMESIMQEQSIDIVDNTVDNTQTAENELDNTMSSPSPRP